eukprot:gene11351-biopygen15954
MESFFVSVLVTDPVSESVLVKLSECVSVIVIESVGDSVTVLEMVCDEDCV